MKRLLSLVAISMLAVFSFNTVAFAAPLNGGSDLTYYFAPDLGAWSTDLTDANDSDADDTAWHELSAEYVLIGSSSQFDTVFVNVTTPAAVESPVADGDLTMMYPDGADDDLGSFDQPTGGGWIAGTLDASYGSEFNSTGIKTFGFTAPGDWAQVQIDGGSEAYYIALNCGSNCASLMGSAMRVGQISVDSSGGGGGGAVPEFSTYMFVAVIMFGVYLVSRKPQVAGKAA